MLSRPKVIIGIVILSVLSITHVMVAASSDQRPFWTEQTSFVQGDDLFAVGVASHAHTIEDGRQSAFAHGVSEAKNFAQVGNLEGLTFHTQMTYEEVNPDETVTVFRLLRVSLSKILALQRRSNGYSLFGGISRKRQARSHGDMNEQERAVARMVRGIDERVDQRSQLSCRYVKEGMPPSQIKSMLGPPDTDTLHGGFGTWVYGTTEIWFIKNRVEYLELGQPCHRQ